MGKLVETEKSLENSILAFLNLQRESRFWKNQSVGIFDKAKGIYRKPNNRYHIKGVSDIIGVYKGIPLFIEVKSSRGTVSVEQARFLDWINALGGCAFVARRLEDVVLKLRDIDNRIALTGWKPLFDCPLPEIAQ